MQEKSSKQKKIRKQQDEYEKEVAKIFHQERNKELTNKFLEKEIKILKSILPFQ